MKNILILGDSYSTFGGCIPQGYAVYYSENGRAEGPAVTKMQKMQTWWAKLLEATNANLVRNDSWSGSTIGYTGYGGEDCSSTSSFIYRYKQLKERGFFQENAVDTILIFGGTNDSWSDAPLGERKLAGWTEKDLYNVLPAIGFLIHNVKKDCPNAEIVVIINTEIKAEIQDELEFVAKTCGVKSVRLQAIDKDCGHPTALGMSQIFEQVKKVLSE